MRGTTNSTCFRVDLQRAILTAHPRSLRLALSSAQRHVGMFGSLVPWPALAQSFAEDVLAIQAAMARGDE